MGYKFLSKEHTIAVKLASEKVANTDAAILARVAPVLAVGATLAAAQALSGYIGVRRAMAAKGEALGSSLKAMKDTYPSLASNPMLDQRFGELSLISPTMASNPGLAHKVILPRMKNGFNIDDIHRMASIENLAMHSAQPAGQHPFWSGMFQAISTSMGNILTPPPGTDPGASPMVIKGLHHKTAGENMDKEAQEIFKDQKVSDECLGSMMATRHIMMKEAGLLDHLPQSIVKDIRSMGAGLRHTATNPNMAVSSAYTGTKNMFGPIGKQLGHLAPALAVGIGIAAVNKLLNMRASSQMSDQADAVFQDLRRSSAVVEENQEMAAQAFDSLRTFAPLLATKPMIARTFVEDIVNKGGLLGPQTVDMLAGAQQKATAPGVPTDIIGTLKGPMGVFNLHRMSGK